ncbi:Ig-like domain-containing protein [Pectobacterium cacticida]|uniref:Ig-like domain-containing protein n=1 Tax=Pectobacterium cacticida TaxID=69221 RepID=UPI002FEFBAAE
MDQKFFRTPFAQSGDRQTIPDSAPNNGSVSYSSGWGPDYAKDPTVDANAKPVEREAMNTVLNAITGAIRQYQTNGYPEWITAANNNGAAFAYDAGVVVDYNGALYLSLVGNNTATPGADATKWQPYIQREATEQEAIDGTDSTQVITPRRLHDGASYLDEQLKTALTPYLLPVGAIIMWPSETPPDGWLELNGQQFDVTENPKLTGIFPDGRLPDFRGRVARAWANGAVTDQDYDRAILSTQDDAISSNAGTGRFQALTFGEETEGAIKIVSRTGQGRLRSNFGGVYSTHFEIDLSSGSTANETRMKNIATMFIIKTDKADSTPGAAVPSAIVVTPQSKTVNAGTKQQFSAAVLPAEFQDDYPVIWSVSDTSLGTISASGVYSATAGRTGTQTIIASISTGLTQTVTLNQYVYLTGISIAAVPSIEVEDTYNLAVTFTPANYTEPVDYASSDAQIASVINGTITGVGAGTATVGVTGRYSGITASRPVTVTPKVVVEQYLQISECLSEIAAAGAAAQASARDHLDLGELATKDGLTAADVNAVPQAQASLGTENLNTVTAPGRKFQSLTSNATLARNYPVALAGMLDVIKTTVAGIRQTFYPYNTTDVYHRYCVDTDANPIVFSTWAKSGGDFLEKSQNLLDVPDKPTARDNIGVGYTISTSEPPASAAGYAAGHIWYQV